VAVDTTALIDSGAAVSVLPYTLGARFGVDWDSLTVPCGVGGSVGSIPGKLLLVDGTLSPFPPVGLIFAWVKSDQVPVLLGQTNFFREFDVCFFRSRDTFQIQPRTP
jgi:hypothetical protein